MTVQKSTKQPEKRTRGENGKVSVGKASGRLRISIPQKYSPTGKQQHIPLGLADTPENRILAEHAAAMLNVCIVRGEYEPSKLQEYIAESLKPNNVEHSVLKVTKDPDLHDLWLDYVEYKKLCGNKESTIETYKFVERWIEKLSTKKIADYRTICEEISGQTTEDHYSRVLDYLSACCDCAVENGRIRANPFKIIRKNTPRPDKDCDPDPFPPEAVEKIIHAYEKHPTYSYMAPLVEFRFVTGCRPGEAFALKWRNINLKEGWIRFSEAIIYIEGKHILIKGTKNRHGEKSGRNFPIDSDRLRKLLEKLAASNPSPDDFVFQEIPARKPKRARKENHIRSYTVQQSWYGNKQTTKGKKEPTHYGGIVYQLAEAGEINKYRPFYNIRHTYITLAIEKMESKGSINSSNIAQLAEYVGNASKTITDHYLKRSGNTNIANIDDLISSKPVSQVGDTSILAKGCEFELSGEQESQENFAKQLNVLSLQPLKATSTSEANPTLSSSSYLQNDESIQLDILSQSQPCFFKECKLELSDEQQCREDCPEQLDIFSFQSPESISTSGTKSISTSLPSSGNNEFSQPEIPSQTQPSTSEIEQLLLFFSLEDCMQA